ncbi:MAG: VWA domain-containing protein, partial [Candidatus Omnitrophica bacterium]|nr:VWA domain-containing protein [Candidatus Omnitrophota bacterium]
MHFLVPAAFAFAAALPVVIVFYLLKRKRVVKLVSSTVLWQRFLAETQASAPFQKLRHNWLLVLQLLMLAFLVFALTRPFFAAPTRQGRLLVVILDVSASMQSTDESPSRFAVARGEALKWVDSLHDNDQMVVIEAAAHTTVKQSPTSVKNALRRALQACEVTDGPTRLTEALKLAETLTRDHPNAEIHLFSDGAAPGLSEFENKNLPLVYHRVGRRAANLGIVSLDVRAHPEDPTRRVLYTSVVNFSTNPAPVELELRLDGK